jgi:hypothetical protein
MIEIDKSILSLLSGSTVMTDEKPTERLEGDALYFWAKKIAEIEFAQKALREFGESELRRRGLGDYFVITNDVYITHRP